MGNLEKCEKVLGSNCWGLYVRKLKGFSSLEAGLSKYVNTHNVDSSNFTRGVLEKVHACLEPGKSRKHFFT